MTEDEPGGDTHGKDARVRSLDARLKAAQTRDMARKPPPTRTMAAADTSVGNRVLADLVGGLAGGLFLGWVIDQFVGTRPWGMLVMMFFGIFVAFRNIIRGAGQSGVDRQRD